MDLIANLEPPKQIVPAIRPLHNPAMGSPAGMLANRRFLAPVRDVRDIPASGHRATDVGIVIPFVQAQVLTDFPGRRPQRAKT
jgi:propanediol utilization protein